MTLPPLRLFTVFEAVTRHGSTQRAAGDLNVTQPAVSQAVKALEEYVGARLFERSTRPFALTPAGEILKAGVSDGLLRISEAIDRVRALHGQDDSSVTVACTVGTATYWLMPRLATFYSEYPDVAVNVVTTARSPELSAGVDLVIRYGSGEWKDGHTVKLFDEMVVPVFSPSLADRVKSRRSLTEAVLLHVVNSDTGWLTWDDYFARQGLPSNRTLGRNFTNYVQATQAALSGQGVMLGWESNVGDLVREGRLVALEDAMLLPEEAFYLVVPARSERKRAAKQFCGWLSKLMSA
ncbi:MAG TPA: LysR family transcriptional regulator [Pseudoclavibacter sp.]|nr:LysR family transcriptional regulator [Pseudoclavibacter sp.]